MKENKKNIKLFLSMMFWAYIAATTPFEHYQNRSMTLEDMDEAEEVLKSLYILTHNAEIVAQSLKESYKSPVGLTSFINAQKEMRQNTEQAFVILSDIRMLKTDNKNLSQKEKEFNDILDNINKNIEIMSEALKKIKNSNENIEIEI